MVTINNKLLSSVSFWGYSLTLTEKKISKSINLSFSRYSQALHSMTQSQCIKYKNKTRRAIYSVELANLNSLCLLIHKKIYGRSKPHYWRWRMRCCASRCRFLFAFLDLSVGGRGHGGIWNIAGWQLAFIIITESIWQLSKLSVLWLFCAFLQLFSYAF